MPPEFDRRTALRAAFAATTLPLVSPQPARGNGMRSRRGTFDTELKQRAARDYQSSLAAYGGCLSNPFAQLAETAREPDFLHFGVLIVGSGYGASICAARLSQHLRPGFRIAVIERGREWQPGSFPDTLRGLFSNARNTLAGPARGSLLNPLGLFNVMLNDEVNILTGNGLGGGSLINASIALRPHAEVFQQDAWPEPLRDVRVLAPYFQQVAKSMSLARTARDLVPKVRARRLAAEQLSAREDFFDLCNVSVQYDYRYLDEAMRNPQGMIQRPCTLCGDCITGCNVGAKNSLVYNYLPIAKWNGTEIYTQCEVDRIEKREGYYRVHLTRIDRQPDGEFTRYPLAVNARVVVLGAGSPGSPSLLLQSQSEEFCFSKGLGQRWSGNGDTIGLIRNTSERTSIGGFGAYPQGSRVAGPTVQSSVNFYRQEDLPKRLLIQDASIPRAAGNVFALMLQDPELEHSMVMLGMGHDGSEGRIEWRDGRWQVKWPGVKEGPYRKMVFREFERLARAHGGIYKRPRAFGDNMVTVHPLGGCGMGDDPEYAATNHLGQVYDGAGWGDDQQAAVHPGLYVADGSLMPTALGVNPYMTIGALSERVARHLLRNPWYQDLFAV